MSKTYTYSGQFKHYVEAENQEEADRIFRSETKKIFDIEVVDKEEW